MKKHEGERLFLSLLLMPFAIVIHGYVLSILWKWFIVSTFSITSISIMEAAGVMFVVDFILMKIDWKDEAMKVPMKEFVNKWVAHAIVTPFVILVIGYILTLFM